MVPFHQDAAFMGDQFLKLNVWTPLVACGESSPGLEVLREGSIKTLIRPTHLGDPDKTPYEQISLPPEWVKQNYGLSKLWHPKMTPGDVLVFSNFTVHRTYQTSDMKMERISLELRCAALNKELKEENWRIAYI